MPRYPFEFHQADALEYLEALGREYNAIHASPPCQKYAITGFMHRENNHPDLLGPTRELLIEIGKPWVIENVDNAPMKPPAIQLCGLMFGLKVFRHRWFESSELLLQPSHPGHGKKRIGIDGMCCVVGHGGGGTNGRMRMKMPSGGDNPKTWSHAMQIDWMTRKELTQAVPPAYTHYIGNQLIRILAK